MANRLVLGRVTEDRGLPFTVLGAPAGLWYQTAP
jgi:hypothetical protein